MVRGKKKKPAQKSAKAGAKKQATATSQEKGARKGNPVRKRKERFANERDVANLTDQQQRAVREYLDLPEPAPGSLWTAVSLKREGGARDTTDIRLYIRHDDGVDPTDPDIRILIAHYFPGAKWWAFGVCRNDAGRLEIDMSDSGKVTPGAPALLTMDYVRRPPSGTVLRIYGERGVVFGEFLVVEIRDVRARELVQEEERLLELRVPDPR